VELLPANPPVTARQVMERRLTLLPEGLHPWSLGQPGHRPARATARRWLRLSAERTGDKRAWADHGLSGGVLVRRPGIPAVLSPVLARM